MGGETQTNTPPNPERPPEAMPAAPHDTRAELAALNDEITSDFAALAREKSDFAGPFDSAEELEKNAPFQKMLAGFRNFLETKKPAGQIPEKFLKPWQHAVRDFLIAEIKSYDWSAGEMGITQVEQALRALDNPNSVGHSKLKGVGSFEVWIKNQTQLGPEYEKWKTDEEKKSKDAVEAEAKRKAEEEAKKAAETPPAQPQTLTETPDDSDIGAGEMGAWKAQIDSISWLPDGIKSGLGKLLGALAAVFLALRDKPLVGGWARKMLGNKALAEAGDEKAKLALKLEKELRKFGLPRDWINDLGDMKTKDVVTALKKKASETSDAEQQDKLNYFVSELERKNGASNEMAFLEFMDPDKNWKDIHYPSQAAAVAAAPVAPTATPASAPVPAPAPPAATAAPATATGTAPPVQPTAPAQQKTTG